MGSVELNDFFARRGVCGLFPLGYWLILTFVSIYQCFLFMANAIYSYKPRFWCAEFGEESSANLTHSEICALGCPNDNWTFHSSGSSPPASISIEWNLVCDREIIYNVVETTFFVSGLLACFFCGDLSDRFGRRPVAIFFSAFCTIVGVNVVWVPDVISYCVIRFLLGFGFIGLLSTVTLRMEMFSADRRFISMNFDMGWTLGAMVLPGVVYLVPNWRVGMCILNGLGLLCIPIIYFSPESVPWLLKNNRLEEAYGILKRISESRGADLSWAEFEKIARDDFAEVEQSAPEKEKPEAGVGDSFGSVGSVDRQTSRRISLASDVGFIDSVPSIGGDRYRRRRASSSSRKMSTASYASDLTGGKGPSLFNETIAEVKKTSLTNELEAVEFIPPAKDNPLEAEIAKESSFLGAFKTPTYLVTLICASCYWSYSNFIFIGLTFSYGTLAGDRLINFLLLTLTSLPARVLAVPACMFLKRRPGMFIFTFITAVSFVISAIVRHSVADYEADHATLRKVLNLTAKWAEEILFEIFALWQQEAFPTLLRGRSFLCACFFARVVSSLACFMSFVQTRHPLELEYTIGIAGLFLAATAFIVPETKGAPLPQTLAELTEMRKKTPPIWKLI